LGFYSTIEGMASKIKNDFKTPRPSTDKAFGLRKLLKRECKFPPCKIKK